MTPPHSFALDAARLCHAKAVLTCEHLRWLRDRLLDVRRQNPDAVSDGQWREAEYRLALADLDRQLARLDVERLEAAPCPSGS